MHQALFKQKPLAAAVHLLLAVSVSATVVVSSTAYAQAVSTESAAASRAYDIPAGSLTQALNSFAQTAGVLLSFEPELTTGKTTKGIKGQYNIKQGFDALLQGSGLAIAASSDNAYTLKKIPVSQLHSTETTLPEVKVSAGVQEDVGYVAKRSTTATKTDTPIIETPQSISVISREEMQDRGTQNLMEALRYTPGVITESYGVDPRGFDYIKLRGFSTMYSGQYLNGLRFYNSGFAVFNTEPFGLERIEVLRGPASVLYGQGDVGGVVNAVSKKPSADSVRNIQLQAGNNDWKQLGLDIGGALNEDGTLLYRLPVSLRESDSPYAYSNGAKQPNDRIYLAPSLTWKPDGRTSFTILSEFQKDKRGSQFHPYQVPYGASTNVTSGVPGFDRMHQRQAMLGYQLEHTFDNQWTFSQNFRYAENDVDYRSITGYALQNNMLSRYLYAAKEHTEQWSVDNRMQGQVDFGGLRHKLLVGLDSYNVRTRQDSFLSYAVPDLDITAPVYNTPITMPGSPSGSTQTKLRQTGIYAQDQIDLGEKWRVTLGARRDEVRQETNNLLAMTQQTQKDSASTYRLGVSYLYNPRIVPYFSYSESFLPNVGRGYGDVAFAPSQGKQYEVGVKYAPQDWDALLTMAVFDLRKTNVLTKDVANTCQVSNKPDCGDNYERAEGEVRTRGLELEFKASLMRQLDVVASYTYLDAEITRSEDGNIGRRPLDVAKQNAALWLNYRASSIPGLSTGMGVRYMGPTYSDNLYLAEVPSYTVLDLALRYKIDAQWNLALNISNLTDKQYVTTCPRGSCYYGSQRTVLATLSHAW